MYSLEFLTTDAAFNDVTSHILLEQVDKEKKKRYLEVLDFQLMKLNHLNIFSVVISRLFITSLSVKCRQVHIRKEWYH